MPRELVEDEVFNLTYDKLRKELKKKRLSAAGKKSDLQFRLVEFLQSQKTAEQQNAIQEEEEQGALDQPMETEEAEEPANRTFTVEEGEPTVAPSDQFLHEGTPTNAVGLVLDEDAKRVMCADLGIDMSNFEVKSRPRVHRVSTRKSLRATVETSPVAEVPQTEEGTSENRGITPSRQRPASRGVDRFAMLHAKEMEKEETIGERRERMQKRHDDLTAHVPEAIKRLATPKTANRREPLNRSANRSATRAWQPQNPAQMTFQFGSNDVNAFSDVANARPDNGECSSSSVVTRKTPGRARAHVDVKKMTRIPGPSRRAATTPRIIPVTHADDSTFVDYISTPKGATPNRVPKRAGYTPHAAKKVFVDTTGLTDREYNLASEEGLIPGKPATKTNVELRQLETKKRRDDIIALKRKMNVK